MLALPPALFRGGSVSASSHASAVDGLADTCLTRAVGAAVKIFRSFYSVANDLATTAGTFRRHRLNGAFKAVKNVRLPPAVISKALSYSLPQVSQRAIVNPPSIKNLGF